MDPKDEIEGHLTMKTLLCGSVRFSNWLSHLDCHLLLLVQIRNSLLHIIFESFSLVISFETSSPTGGIFRAA